MSNLIKTEDWLKNFKLNIFPQPEIIRLKHPVLFFHGYGSIASLVKPTPLHDVCLLFREHGILSFAPNIVPYATIETRAETWKEIVLRLAGQLDIAKFNIIAHSMGGLDARYAITHLGLHRNVESLTTLSSPHHGSSLAEFAIDTPEEVKSKLASFMNWMGNQLYPEVESDTLGSLEQLTRNYLMEEFNPSTPNADDVSYYSYSAAVGKGTETTLKPTILKYQNRHIYEEEGVNDGFVSVPSARWGEYLKSIPLSHLEQIHFNIDKDRVAVWRNFWVEAARMLASKGH